MSVRPLQPRALATPWEPFCRPALGLTWAKKQTQWGSGRPLRVPPLAGGFLPGLVPIQRLLIAVRCLL